MLVDPVEICKLIHSAFIFHNICLEDTDNVDKNLIQISMSLLTTQMTNDNIQNQNLNQAAQQA